ncbi:trigger factor [Salinisphaera sp. USBA-960]|uniref:trigger factor n=1 Tax=Salinisphaera orenii TaxID=856731 RepID=UPI000DBE294F|nr:trigger factor [Salifodinibacter halophilus]NNC25431.1 trigger factor [Salifodinibacter halophilus]
MDVSVEHAGNLGRRVKVEIPADRVKQTIDEKIRRVGEKAHVPGFRPGKAPTQVLFQRYGDQVRQEAASELIQSVYSEALEEAEISPAGQPEIEMGEIKTDAPLAFTANVEVYPEIELTGLDALSVERPDASVTDDDVDNTIERVRQRNATRETAERPAQEADQVTVDYTGYKGGEAFDGGSAENVTVELGSNYFLADLEASLHGRSAGETYTVEITFPDDYQDEDLAGQPASLEVSVKSVEVDVPPALDEEFIRGMGVEEATVDALQSEVRNSLEEQVKNAIESKVKSQVMDSVYEANPIDVPEAMVSQEIERMRGEAKQNLPEGMQGDDEMLKQILPDSALREQAVKRVALGLLLSQIISDYGLEVEKARVDAKIDEVAASYGDQADQVRNYYQQNPQMIEGLQAMVMEEQVIEKLLEDATVTEKSMTVDDLLSEQNQSGGA